MISDEYIDTSALDLKLSLVEGKVDTSQFNIFISQKISNHNFFVEAGIIGASHFLILGLGDKFISEVFACTEIETNFTKAYYGPFRGLFQLEQWNQV